MFEPQDDGTYKMKEIEEQEYFIHEVIVSNSKGKLFYYHSDNMNENFFYDKEYDELSPVEEE